MAEPIIPPDSDRPLLNRTSAGSLFRFFAYAAMAVPVIILPIILRELDLPIIRNTNGNVFERFEVFGFFSFLAVATVAGNELRKRWGGTPSELLPIVIGALVSLHFVTLITGYPLESRDYLHYEQAGIDLLKGDNPYENRTYLYPPLFAKGLVATYRAVDWLYFSIWGETLPGNRKWDIVFYLYQCNQFFLVVIAYLLCYRFARVNKISPLIASVLVGALFLFNTPLFRTLRHNQVNLWVLDLTLGGILLLPRFSPISGAAIALATHLKVYPFILLLPWTIARQWRAVTSAILVSIGIVMIQTDFFRDWTLWLQCMELFNAFPGKIHFRDNSLHSITFNLIYMPALLFGEPSDNLQVVTDWLWRIADAIAIVLFIRRFLRREFLYRSLSQENRVERNADRLYGHSMDGLALALLIAPSVWEHVYILAMPIFLYAAAVCDQKDFRKVCVAGFFIFSVPIFDVFPISYHRIAGLLFLLYIYSPYRRNKVVALSL